MPNVLNTTPTNKAYEAMNAFVDAVFGEAPDAKDFSSPAAKRREKREWAFSVLHRLYSLAMRHGHAAAHEEMVRRMQIRDKQGLKVPH